MFIKITGSKNLQYVQIVRSHREKGRVRHEVLFNMGRLDVLRNSAGMKKFLRRLNEILNADMI